MGADSAEVREQGGVVTKGTQWAESRGGLGRASTGMETSAALLDC